MTTNSSRHPFIDWADFWRQDRSEADWLYEPVLARGRGHAIFAGHKTGKSLFALWCCGELVDRGHVVVYLDYEMGEDDLYQRLSDMGYGPDSDLERLLYWQLPSLSALNTVAGAADLLRHLDLANAEWPDRHLALVIDTTSRAVIGEENSADTIQAFYRHTGIGLKRRGITWARLDHAGKDRGQGQRGSSAKGDDVDVVWELRRTAKGIELRLDAARMGWVPEAVALTLLTDPVLRFEPVVETWPLGTQETAALLDSLGVAMEVSGRDAQKALQEAGQGRRAGVVRSAVKYRRTVATTPRTDPGSPSRGSAGTHPGPTLKKSHSHGEGALLDSSGPTPAGQGGPIGGPVGDPEGPSPAPALSFDDLHRELETAGLAPVEEPLPDSETVSIETLYCGDDLSVVIERPCHGRQS